MRTSLFQGTLLYTTQIWSWVPDAGPGYYGTMAKTYPPGVHQEMIFEVADHEYVHSSIMSGLTPVKSQDAILGLPDPSDPQKYMMLSPKEQAPSSRRSAAPRTSGTNATGSSPSSARTTTRSRRSSRWSTPSAPAASRIRSSSPTT